MKGFFEEHGPATEAEVKVEVALAEPRTWRAGRSPP